LQCIGQHWFHTADILSWKGNSTLGGAAAWPGSTTRQS